MIFVIWGYDHVNGREFYCLCQPHQKLSAKYCLQTWWPPTSVQQPVVRSHIVGKHTSCFAESDALSSTHPSASTLVVGAPPG
mmetsp:Transcript_140614/g.262319  ORF Transcript_140614/g.262319 Transcript_140614/m.262319 type:complete len:82 (-) Transcript_140614:2643-2888(-)